MNAFCPFGPVTVRVRLVSGMSGTFANVTEFVARFTTPLIVSENGAGNATVIAGEVAEPDSVTVPFASAMSGTSGEVAVAVPIVQPGPDPVRHGTSAPTFGVIDLPRPSVMLLLADSFAAWVTPRTSSPPLSFASLVTVAVSAGAYGSVLQPVTLSARGRRQCRVRGQRDVRRWARDSSTAAAASSTTR